MPAIPSPSRPAARRGFTLIELLLVVIVIGVLAAIAMSRFQHVRDRASRTVGMSDLRNLVATQQSYFEDHAAYAPDLATLDLRGSAGTEITIVEVKPDGWSAEAKRLGVGQLHVPCRHRSAEPCRLTPEPGMVRRVSMTHCDG